MRAIRTRSAWRKSAEWISRCSRPARPGLEHLLLQQNFSRARRPKLDDLSQIVDADVVHLLEVVRRHAHDPHLAELVRREIGVTGGAIGLDALRRDVADAQVPQLAQSEVLEARAAKLANVVRLHAE